mgnify:FL=1
MFSGKTGILCYIWKQSQRRRMCLEIRKKYIWGCVFCVVLTAVLIGVIYYYNDVRGTDQVSEGTLIWQAVPVKERTVADVFRE